MLEVKILLVIAMLLLVGVAFGHQLAKDVYKDHIRIKNDEINFYKTNSHYHYPGEGKWQ